MTRSRSEQVASLVQMPHIKVVVSEGGQIEIQKEVEGKVYRLSTTAFLMGSEAEPVWRERV